MDEVLLLERFRFDLPWVEIDPMEEALHESTLVDSIAGLAKGTTKENLFDKLMTILKKAYEWIANKVKQFISFIKRLFKRGPTKSSSQIMEEIGITPINISGDIPEDVKK